MDVWFSSTHRVAVVTLSGELDLIAAERLRRALLRANDAHSLLVVDFAGVSFVDSTVVGVLMAAAARARAERKRLLVVNAHTRALKVFQTLGVTHVLTETPPPPAGSRSVKPA